MRGIALTYHLFLFVESGSPHHQLSPVIKDRPHCLRFACLFKFDSYSRDLIHVEGPRDQVASSPYLFEFLIILKSSWLVTLCFTSSCQSYSFVIHTIETPQLKNIVGLKLCPCSSPFPKPNSRSALQAEIRQGISIFGLWSQPSLSHEHIPEFVNTTAISA